MIIQLFNLPTPLEYNGELLRYEWSEDDRVFIIKLGDNGKPETVMKMTREEAVLIQEYLNKWNPFWKDYLKKKHGEEIEALKLQLAELDAENTRLEGLLYENGEEWLELYRENERLLESLSEYESDNI